jgi:hypothetical protein
MIDPSAFSDITGQIDYGERRKMPLKPGEPDYGEQGDQSLTWYKQKNAANPIAQRDRKDIGYQTHDGLEGVRATEALREQQRARGRKR